MLDPAIHKATGISRHLVLLFMQVLVLLSRKCFTSILWTVVPCYHLSACAFHHLTRLQAYPHAKDKMHDCVYNMCVCVCVCECVCMNKAALKCASSVIGSLPSPLLGIPHQCRRSLQSRGQSGCNKASAHPAWLCHSVPPQAITCTYADSSDQQQQGQHRSARGSAQSSQAANAASSCPLHL